jgi:hypothetical protein
LNGIRTAKNESELTWKEAVSIRSDYHLDTTGENNLNFLVMYKVKGPGFEQQLLNIKLRIDILLKWIQ